MYADDTATRWSRWTNVVTHVLFPRIAEFSLGVEATRSSHVAGRGLQ